MKYLIKTLIAWVGVFTFYAACADEPASISLLPAKDKELTLDYGQSHRIEFECPWDILKIPVVLEFTARIDTPPTEASSGGPVLILKIELNGEILKESDENGRPRLLNKPLKSKREFKDSDVVWFEKPFWSLMYCGSWDPPSNQYTPFQGSPVQFVIDVTDRLNSKKKNEIVLTYREVLVDELTLADACRAGGMGDATIIFGEMTLRPLRNSDMFQVPK